MVHFELIIFFFVVAVVYASVGFGGGSSYLAILSLYDLPFQEIRIAALLCNIIVVTGGVILNIIHKGVAWKKIMPLVLMSVPMAFLGASIRMKENTFFVILGFTLLAASVLLWMKTRSINPEPNINSSNVLLNVGIGGGIGFLSGMVGIGGGIFLSPLLNLMRWDSPKVIAVAATVFILVNSVAGLAGQYSQVPVTLNWNFLSALSVAVFAGGQVGSRIGIVTFNGLIIRRVTAALVGFAGIEVLIKHF